LIGSDLIGGRVDKLAAFDIFPVPR
jgi:hypothetical protein